MFQYSKFRRLKQDTNKENNLWFSLLMEYSDIFFSTFFYSCCMAGFLRYPEGNSLCTPVIAAQSLFSNKISVCKIIINIVTQG